MPSRLFIIILGFFLVPLLSFQAEAAKCGPFPQVAWWGKLTHEGVKAYVAQKHGGDWSGYLDKWDRQLANVRTIYGQGKGIKVPSTGITIKGIQLSDYIGKLAQRVDVNQCLSKEKNDPTTSTTTKTTKKVLKVTPFGKGVNAYRAGNFKIAHDIWLPLAKSGNTKSQNALGFLYRKGYGVESDLDISRQWYGKSAAKGNKVAIFSLGDIGLTTAKSKDEVAKALILIRKSANLNYGAAQFNLAEILHQGKDLAKDDGEAYFWTSLAVMNNFKKAQALKERLEKLLPENDKQSQSKRARHWLLKNKK